MAASETPPAGFRDPWPSAQGWWAEPPWRLRGRVVTAWFELPRAAVARMISPDLMVDDDRLRVRLRFYDLAFAAAGPARATPPPLPDGRFREAALGVPTRIGDLRAETSVSLWSDSFTYVMWGREAFGWPILPASVDLEGDIWTKPLAAGLTGGATMCDAFGRAALRDIVVAEPRPPSAGRPTWITPRRVVEHAPARHDRREVLVVRPTVLDPGTMHHGTAVVEMAFPDGHPYAVGSPHPAELQAVDGLDLLVADDVAVIDAPRPR